MVITRLLTYLISLRLKFSIALKQIKFVSSFKFSPVKKNKKRQGLTGFIIKLIIIKKKTQFYPFIDQIEEALISSSINFL